MVRLPADRSAAIDRLSDAEKQAYFNRIVGAKTVEGNIETVSRFSPPDDPALAVTPTLAGAPTLFIHKDPKKAVLPALEPGQARSSWHFGAMAELLPAEGLVQLFRYDKAKGDLFYQPRDWKKIVTRRAMSCRSPAAKSAYELRVIPLTAGDYVLNGATVGATMPPTSSNCFGAPMIHVEPGQYAYLGDASPFMGAKLSTGEKTVGMVFTRHFTVARDAMAKLRPELSAKLVEPPIYNRATYSCAAVKMDRYDWPNMADLPFAPTSS